MADIKFNCPGCKQSLEAPSDMAGQLIECPSCKRTIEVPPAPRVPRVENKPPPPVTPRPAPSPPRPLQTVGAVVNCPACGGIASKEADRCPHCAHPIKRGLLGKAGTERYVNVGCLVIIMVIVALALLRGC